MSKVYTGTSFPPLLSLTRPVSAAKILAVCRWSDKVLVNSSNCAACWCCHVVTVGIVFLVFRNETRPGLLPNEVTSISTVWALFVRAFSDTLSMPWFESSKWTIYFLDPTTGVYRVLQDLRLDILIIIIMRIFIAHHKVITCIFLSTQSKKLVRKSTQTKYYVIFLFKCHWFSREVLGGVIKLS